MGWRRGSFGRRSIYFVLAAVTITNQKKSDEFPVSRGLTAVPRVVGPARPVEAERAPPYWDRILAARSDRQPRPCSSTPRSATAPPPSILLTGTMERWW